jgi:hypothetical protein
VEAFEKVVSMLDYPIYVVTTQATSGPAASSCSPVRSASDRHGSWSDCLIKNHTYRRLVRRRGAQPLRARGHIGHLLESVAGDAPEKFEQPVTFADVRDLEPGHEA